MQLITLEHQEKSHTHTHTSIYISGDFEARAFRAQLEDLFSQISCEAIEILSKYIIYC